jgi:cell division septation protein DedD
MSVLYKKSGYYTLIENFINEGQEFYRVLVGGYDSKQKAEFIKKRLERAAGERYFILVR